MKYLARKARNKIKSKTNKSVIEKPELEENGKKEIEAKQK